MPSNGTAWIIPFLTLATAVLLLVSLQQHLTASHLPPLERSRKAIIEAVRTAPAAPFRYGGRTVGNTLDQLEPPRGWTDLGWEIRPRTGSGYWVVRRHQGPSGAERIYRFMVGALLDAVIPANDRAQQLMNQVMPNQAKQAGPKDG